MPAPGSRCDRRVPTRSTSQWRRRSRCMSSDVGWPAMADAQARIEELRREAEAAAAAAASAAELEELRVRYLGRKAELTTILRGIAELPQEERGEVGGAANGAREELEELLEHSAERLDASELEAKLVSDRVDVTLPGAPPRPVGHLHLIARTTRLIE